MITSVVNVDGVTEVRFARPLVLIAALGLLCSCESPREQEQRKSSSSLARGLEIIRGCNQEYAKGDRSKAVIRMLCYDRALDPIRSSYPFGDLLDKFLADRRSIAERYRRGQLTSARADEELLAQRNEMIVQEQRRLTDGRTAGFNEVSEAIEIITTGIPACERAGERVTCF